jgi:HK97 family phage prohead protease
MSGLLDATPERDDLVPVDLHPGDLVVTRAQAEAVEATLDSPAHPDVPEVRTAVLPFTFDELEVRANADGSTSFVGHAAVFDRLSLDLGGFRERITRGAFSTVLDAHPDVRFLWNHNADFPLARTTNQTLELSEDPRGLRVFARIAPTSMGNDLATLIKRGDISQMSFAFSVADGGDEWLTQSDGSVIRTINEIGSLFEVSAVTFPAYPQTDASVRKVSLYTADTPADAPTNSEDPAPLTDEDAPTRSLDRAQRESRLRLIKKGLAPEKARTRRTTA